MRGHVLVWHNQTPEWFFREGYRDDGEYVDRETMLARMESYIRQVLEFTQEQYPGRDLRLGRGERGGREHAGKFRDQSRVLTSGPTTRAPRRTCGTGWSGPTTSRKRLPTRRKYAAPGVKLFYNDYNTFQPSKTEAICGWRLISRTRASSTASGCKGTWTFITPASKKGRTTCGTRWRFSQLGLEIHITELSIARPMRAPAPFSGRRAV